MCYNLIEKHNYVLSETQTSNYLRKGEFIMLNKRKRITIILTLIISTILITGCNSKTVTTIETSSNSSTSSDNDSIIGTWTYHNDKYNTETSYTFSSDGTCFQSNNGQSRSATYTIEADGTLFIDAGFTTNTYKKATVDEILNMENTQIKYYAIDGNKLYLGGYSQCYIKE